MNRIQRINALIRDLAGQFLLAKIRIANTLVTATRVETSLDLRSAKIYITVFPEKEEAQVLKILKGRWREWQKYLSLKFKAKFIPHSQFLIDKGEKSARRVDALLKIN